MQFDDNEIQELADFFSRRFPEDEQRQRMASAAGITDGFDDWGRLLREAQACNRLYKLADVTTAAAPEDDNLRDVCTILTAPRRRRRATMSVSAAAVVVLGVVLGLGLSPTAPVPVEEPAAVLASANAAPPPSPVPEVLRSPVAMTPAAAPAKEAVALPAEAPEAAPEDSAEEVPAPEPAGSDVEEPELAPSPFAASAPLTGRCRAKDGALIGYWYAGALTPGAIGAEVEIPVTVNVRADFPDVHNNFDARAPVRCVLLKGERVMLSGEPIQVPGDRYWVPLHGGDLH